MKSTAGRPSPFRFAVACAVVAAFAFAAAALAFGSTPVSSYLFAAALRQVSGASSVTWSSVEGSLLSGLSFRDLEVIGSRDPALQALKAASARFEFASMRLSGLRASLEGVRLEPALGDLARNPGVVHAERAGLDGGRLTLRELLWDGADLLPGGYRTRIQTIVWDVPAGPTGLVALENGRLQSGDQSVLKFYALPKDGRIEANLFSASLDVADTVAALPVPEKFLTARGEIGGLDVSVRPSDAGEEPEWRAEGEMTVRSLGYGGYRFEGVHVKTDSLRFRPGSGQESGRDHDERERVIAGTLWLEGGQMIRGAARLDVEKSRIDLAEEGRIASMDLNASSTVGDVKIRLRVTGDPDHPVLKVRSDPSLPEERLYLMLLTGREWKGLDRSVEEGKVSASLAGEVADYLLFGGTGRAAARRLGIKDWAVDPAQGGIALTQSVTPQLDVKYGIARAASADVEEASGKVKTAGLDYRLNDRSTVSLEGSLVSAEGGKSGESKRKPAQDADVMLSVKNKF